MKRYDVYGIGNALVDMVFEVSPEFLRENGIEKGLMTLVDGARQEELVRRMHGLRHKRSCGGSAANSLIAVAQLGGSAFYSCNVANDEGGDFYLADLVGTGVETNSDARREKGITGRCMVFVTPDADRTMNTHLGVSVELSREAIRPEAVTTAEYAYIEGYLLATAKGREAAFAVRDIARAAGVRTALTFSDPALVASYREDFLRLVGEGFDLLFCNEAEAMTFTGVSDVEKAAEALKRLSRRFMITRGPRGAWLYDGRGDIHVLTYPVDPVDTNGAGDIFAGCVLYALSRGKSIGDAGRLACLAATALVTQFGARLTPERIKTIRDGLFGS